MDGEGTERDRPGRERDSGAQVRARSHGPEFHVGVVPAGGVVWQILEGHVVGQLELAEDGLRVRLRRLRFGWAGVGWLGCHLSRKYLPPGVEYAVLGGVLLLLVLELIPRRARHPWTEIPSATVAGDRVAFEFAAAGDRKDLVVRLLPQDRERFLALLKERTRVDSLDDDAPA